MRPPRHQRIFVAYRRLRYHLYQRGQRARKHLPGLFDLHRQRRIQHIRRGQPQVDKASFGTQLLLHRTQEGDDIVMRLLLDLLHTLRVVTRLLYFRQRLCRNDPLTRPRLTHQQFHFEPGVAFMSRRPDGSHSGPRISFNHAIKINLDMLHCNAGPVLFISSSVPHVGTRFIASAPARRWLVSDAINRVPTCEMAISYHRKNTMNTLISTNASYRFAQHTRRITRLAVIATVVLLLSIAAIVLDAVGRLPASLGGLGIVGYLVGVIAFVVLLPMLILSYEYARCGLWITDEEVHVRFPGEKIQEMAWSEARLAVNEGEAYLQSSKGKEGLGHIFGDTRYIRLHLEGLTPEQREQAEAALAQHCDMRTPQRFALVTLWGAHVAMLRESGFSLLTLF